jgi:hypothetical protein
MEGPAMVFWEALGEMGEGQFWDGLVVCGCVGSSIPFTA